MTVLVITTAGEVKESHFPDDFLKFCYREIDCTLVDRIMLTSEIDMWVDDEGMFSQSMNPVAAYVCNKFGYPASGIYGNAVISGTKWTDDGPEAGPLSDKAVKYIERVSHDFRVTGALM